MLELKNLSIGSELGQIGERTAKRLEMLISKYNLKSIKLVKFSNGEILCSIVSQFTNGTCKYKGTVGTIEKYIQKELLNPVQYINLTSRIARAEEIAIKNL